MGAAIEVETLSHPMMPEFSMRWEKGPSGGAGRGGGAEESGRRGGRAQTGEEQAGRSSGTARSSSRRRQGSSRGSRVTYMAASGPGLHL